MTNLPVPLADFLEKVRRQAARTDLSYPLLPVQGQRPRTCRCYFCIPQLYIHNLPQPKIRPSRRHNCEARMILKPTSHEPLVLAQLAINWFQPVNYDYTREQHTAVAAWRKIWPEPPSDLRSHTYLKGHLTLLRRAFKIFNTLFFCRKLPRVHIGWLSEEVPMGSPPCLARTTIYATVNLLLRPRITFNSSHIIEAKPRRDKLLSALLHEMIHVYLQYFACRHRNCICWRALGENLGEMGHGRAFLWVAKAMEEVSEPLLGWRVDLWDLAHHKSEVGRGEEHYSLHDLRVCWPGFGCQR